MQLFSYRGKKIDVRHSIDEHPNMTAFPMHAHQRCELYCFLSGVGHYSVEGNDYLLKPGTILVMRDGETHKLHISPGVTYERLTINFPIDFIPVGRQEIIDLFYNRPLGVNNLFVPDELSGRYINDNLAKIISCGRADEPEEKVAFYLNGILLELSRLQKQGKELSPEQTSTAHTNSDLVSSIIAFINANLTEIPGLDVFEQKFFFSKSYLNRVFKESTGSSIWDYVVLKRLLLARTLMREGKPAAVAAAECGFCDYSSFYRQYKRRFNTSPIHDREKNDRPSPNYTNK